MDKVHTILDDLCRGKVGQVASVSNLNLSYLEFLWVELSLVELGLGFDNSKLERNSKSQKMYEQDLVFSVKLQFK